MIPNNTITIILSRITSVDGEKKPSDDDEATSAALSSSSTSYSSTCLPLEVRYLRQYALENNDWHEFQVRQRELKYVGLLGDIKCE